EKKPETETPTCPGAKKPFKPAGKSALIADRKGRRVLVQRTGSEEARARNEDEANGYGPPRRAQRGYHCQRHLTPLDAELDHACRRRKIEGPQSGLALDAGDPPDGRSPARVRVQH